MLYYIDTTLDNLVQIKQIKHFIHTNHSDITDIPLSFDFWQIVYVKSGTLNEYRDNEMIQLSENDILFHKPGELSHSDVPENGEYPNAYFISFVCHSPIMEFFIKYKNKLSDESIEIMRKLIDEATKTFKITTSTNLSMVKRAPTAPLGGFQMFRIYMESLLITILREETEKTNKIWLSKDDLDNHIHTRTTEYLASKIYDNITLDDICATLKLGKTFLCTKFKALEGIPIMTYMNKLKIEEACKLIKTDKYNMSEIAEMLKFSNPYYFSRAFKRIKGVSPMEYKNISLKN